MSSFNEIYLNDINRLHAFYSSVEANVEAREIRRVGFSYDNTKKLTQYEVAGSDLQTNFA